MKTNDVARAWTDRDFRNGLSTAEQEGLPDHPTGIVQLDDEVLTSIVGGCQCFLSIPDCSCVPPGQYCP